MNRLSLKTRFMSPVIGALSLAVLLWLANTGVAATVLAAADAPPPDPAKVQLIKAAVEQAEEGPRFVTETVLIGGQVRFVITATNTMTYPTVVVVKDTMPAGLRAVAVNAGSCPAAVLDGGAAVMGWLGVPAGQSRTILIKAVSTPALQVGAVLTNTAYADVKPPPALGGGGINPLTAAGADAIGCGGLNPALWAPGEFPVDPPIVGNDVVIDVLAPDLGDAPDSTNHFGQLMAAYPGPVQANFPTVFDPALPLPGGPFHRNARPLHLGQLVSAEIEADIGADADGVNNIKPVPVGSQRANRDRHDDGVGVGQFNIVDCQTAVIPVRVFVAPQAVQFFQQLGAKAKLNAWLDFNRDGDWADATDCPTGRAREHIVIDQDVDVVTLGPGLHTLSVATGLIRWPAATATDPSWLRVTLSESPAPKPLTDNGVAYGDGRGEPTGYLLGETEDYRYRPQLVAEPDLQVQVDAVLPEIGAAPAVQAAVSLDFEEIKWTVHFRNDGDKSASNSLLQFEIQMATGCAAGDSTIEAVRVLPRGRATWNGCVAQLDLGNVEPGGSGTVLISQRVTNNLAAGTKLTGTVSSASTQAIDAAGITLDASTPKLIEWRGRPPILIDSLDGTTNETTVRFRGLGQPNSLIEVTLTAGNGAAQAFQGQTDAIGRFLLEITGLTDGGYGYELGWRGCLTCTVVSAAGVAMTADTGAPTGYLNVDTSLPWNPISLVVIDSQGRRFRPANSAGRTDAQGWVARLKAGAYTIGLRTSQCSSVEISIDGEQSYQPMDQNGDRFTKSIIVPAGGIPSVKLRGDCGSGTEDLGGGSVVLWDPEGVVSDLVSGAPLADANVACLVSNGAAQAAGANELFTLWPATEFGQQNPQTTAADGYFSFYTPAGLYRLNVQRSGYQPYRSTDIPVVDAPVRYDVPLTAAVNRVADHVVQITKNGFDPAVLNVALGSVVEFVNTGAEGHTSTSQSVTASDVQAAGWDSGLLLTGESYKVQFDEKGTFSFGDQTNPLATGAIVVDDARMFLPVIQK